MLLLLNRLGVRQSLAGGVGKPRKQHCCAFAGVEPKLSKGAWLAPTATLIGNVEVEEEGVVWYGAILRGDVNSIQVGRKAHIGSRCVVHVSSGGARGPQRTVVGDSAVVDSGTLLHACVVGAQSYIEAGCTILDAAEVGERAWLRAGSLVGIGKKIPAGELWGGVPAKFIKKLTEEELKEMEQRVVQLHLLAREHQQATSTTSTAHTVLPP